MRFLPIREDPNDSAAPGFIALGNNEDEGVQTPSSSGSRSRGGSDKTTSGTRGGSPSKQQSGGGKRLAGFLAPRYISRPQKPKSWFR